ncbi:hypothetical protein [Neptuniibacter sp. QD37_11]|uniref:hypothetical protein n=1 Tax=Neptuniibacter sp. QD37_11 TaxID=3398209 RepID=UPI0039F4B6D4
MSDYGKQALAELLQEMDEAGHNFLLADRQGAIAASVSYNSDTDQLSIAVDDKCTAGMIPIKKGSDITIDDFSTKGVKSQIAKTCLPKEFFKAFDAERMANQSSTVPESLSTVAFNAFTAISNEEDGDLNFLTDSYMEQVNLTRQSRLDIRYNGFDDSLTIKHGHGGTDYAPEVGATHTISNFSSSLNSASVKTLVPQEILNQVQGFDQLSKGQRLGQFNKIFKGMGGVDYDGATKTDYVSQVIVDRNLPFAAIPQENVLEGSIDAVKDAGLNSLASMTKMGEGFVQTAGGLQKFSITECSYDDEREEVKRAAVASKIVAGAGIASEQVRYAASGGKQFKIEFDPKQGVIPSQFMGDAYYVKQSDLGSQRSYISDYELGSLVDPKFEDAHSEAGMLAARISVIKSRSSNTNSQDFSEKLATAMVLNHLLGNKNGLRNAIEFEVSNGDNGISLKGFRMANLGVNSLNNLNYAERDFVNMGHIRDGKVGTDKLLAIPCLKFIENQNPQLFAKALDNALSISRGVQMELISAKNAGLLANIPENNQVVRDLPTQQSVFGSNKPSDSAKSQFEERMQKKNNLNNDKDDGGDLGM